MIVNENDQLDLFVVFVQSPHNQSGLIEVEKGREEQMNKRINK